MKRTIYQLVVIVMSLFVINGLSRSLLELWQQRQRVDRAKQELSDLEQKEVELKGQLRYFQSDEYVEKIAREKLLLGKEGETVLLLPTGPVSDQSQESRVQEEDIKDNVPIWKRWMKKLGLEPPD